MKTLHASVQYLWAICFLAQGAVCLVLITHRHFRTLPIFTAFVTLNLLQGIFLYAVYARYGVDSKTAYLYAWWSEAITLAASAFAIMEVLRLVLIPYRGIWGLAWRVLAVTSSVVLICVAVASQGNADWALMEADRGYHLIFATALIACFALIRYYFIPVDRTYNSLLAGFCFYCCVEILINTVLQGVLYRQFENFEPIWQTVTMSSYLMVQVLWAAALARPLPAMAQQRTVLPPSVYMRVSPEINYQLQAINKQLMNFWNIEEPRH